MGSSVRLAAFVCAALLVAGAVEAAPRHASRTASAKSIDAAAKPVDLTPPEPAVIPRSPSASLTESVPDRPPERTRRWDVFGGGLALFATGYALDVGLTYGLDHQPSGLSLIPLIGPLIQCGDSWAMIAPAQTGNPQVDAQANPQIAAMNHQIQVIAYAVLSVDFVIQLAGVTMAIVGAASTRLVPGYASRPTRTAWQLRGAGVAVTF
ncbi:MAG TPA: hypothetical protein VFF06_19565 [Polyangia bacterium]|nr:hypothetical protein [Polyangia bacterium]